MFLKGLTRAYHVVSCNQDPCPYIPINISCLKFYNGDWWMKLYLCVAEWTEFWPNPGLTVGFSRLANAVGRLGAILLVGSELRPRPDFYVVVERCACCSRGPKYTVSRGTCNLARMRACVRDLGRKRRLAIVAWDVAKEEEEEDAVSFLFIFFLYFKFVYSHFVPL